MFSTCLRSLSSFPCIQQEGVLRLFRQFVFLSGLLFLLLPDTAAAVSLGKATLKSGLGARLNMEVNLTQVSVKQARSLKFSLLAKNKYKTYGLSYQPILSDLRFTLQKRSNDQYYLKVWSTKAVKDSVLHIALMMSLNGRPAVLTKTYSLQMAKGVVVTKSPRVKAKPRSVIIKNKSVPRSSNDVSSKREARSAPTELRYKKIDPKVIANKSSPADAYAMSKSENAVVSDKTVMKKNAAPLKNQAKSNNTLASADDDDVRNFEAMLRDNPPAAGAPAPSATSERYKVELSADKEIKKPGPPGILSVWIGDPAFSPVARPETTTVDTSIAAVGETAKVIPFAPMFTIEPAEYKCMKIDPSGSEARFSITPKDTGTYEVGATVDLYDTPDCSGIPIPKPVTSLKVAVVVDAGEVIEGFGMQLWTTFWNGFLDFWGWIVTTFFALLMFLTRKKLKKIFGFDNKSDDA